MKTILLVILVCIVAASAGMLVYRNFNAKDKATVDAAVDAGEVKAKGLWQKIQDFIKKAF